MKIQKLLLFFPVFFFTSCINEIIEPNPNLVGSYKSSVFILPGPADGSIDVQANGGYFELTLNNNFQFNSHEHIPSDNSLYLYGKDTIITGNYFLKNDTICFDKSFVTYNKMVWHPKLKQIKTIDIILRGPFKIILNKTNNF